MMNCSILRVVRIITLILISIVFASCNSFIKTEKGENSKLENSYRKITKRKVPASVYQIVYSEDVNSIFVAANKKNYGIIYRLDPVSLEIKQEIKLDSPAFALALNKSSNVLYVGHTLDKAISAIDAVTGEILSDVEFDYEKDKSIAPYGLEVSESDNLLFIGSESGDGVIWVLDGLTLAVKQILQSAEGVGLYNNINDRKLYSSSKVLKIFDTDTFKLTDVIDVNDVANSLLLNIVVDNVRNQAYVTDFNNDSILVFDLKNLSLKQRVPTAAGPVGILFSDQNQEVYVANRLAGKVTVYNADDFSLRQQFDVKQYPNSLAIDANAQNLYVSVKQEASNVFSNKDSIVKISLTTK